MHVKEAVTLTGDADAIGRSVAAKLKLDKVYTELLPDDKIDRVEELMHSDAVIEVADIVIMTDELSKITLAMKISKKTLLIVRQSITLSLVVNLVH